MSSITSAYGLLKRAGAAVLRGQAPVEAAAVEQAGERIDARLRFHLGMEARVFEHARGQVREGLQ